MWWIRTVNGSVSNSSSSARARIGPIDNPSVWAVKDLYLAHAALTDIDGKHFWYDERPNREGPGIAGASFTQQRIWNGNWQAKWNGEAQTLDAITETFRFHLDLKPEKPFVINGENGLSQKAEGQGRASYYVSFPLLSVAGKITTPDGTHDVTGQAWMDHEWFTEQLGRRSGRLGLVQRPTRQQHRTDAVRTAQKGRQHRSVFVRHFRRCDGQAAI